MNWLARRTSQLLGALILCPCAAASQANRAAGDDFAMIFREIHELVAKDFVDPKLGGLDWNAVAIDFGKRAANAGDRDEFADIVNEMLARLNTSHTYLYTSREPAYFQLLSIFRTPLAGQIQAAHPDNIELKYPGIGIFTLDVNGAVFISGVLEGAPAHRAGLRLGDRIISVNGELFHPIGSFENRIGADTPMQVQRHDNGRPDSTITVTIRPEAIEPASMILNAIKRSARIIEKPPRRIGYIHMWSMAGEEYREALREQIASGVLRDADALILDFRDGWGGANPDDLNMFHQRVPVMTHIASDGSQQVVDAQWRKPVALLVNEGTRSGKEVFAFGFQKHGIGPVIGTRTAGAVVGGRPYLIRPGILLYLAVADVRIDGERLEGRGVMPDVEVPFDIRYADGRDPQLDAASESLAHN